MHSDYPATTPFAGSQLDSVRHVCALFNSDEEEYRVLLPFIRDGFEYGHAAIHVVKPQGQKYIQQPSPAGIDETSGLPLKPIVCRMDRAADGRTLLENLVEFESRVNDVWRRHGDVVICTYRLQEVSAGTVIDIMRTHPLLREFQAC